MNEERGSSLIEVIGFMAIIGFLGIGVWTLINSAMARFRLSQGVIQLQSLEKGITRFYASAGNYDGLSKESAVQELINNRIPPRGMATSSGGLINSFGTDVEIKNVAPNSYGTTSDSFLITFKSLSATECREMASIVWSEGDGVNIVSITIGDTKFTWPSFSGSEANTLPIRMSDAMDSCAEAPKDVSWEFR